MARARGAGLALKGLQWFLRAVEFCCAALVLGVFSYYLAALHNHGLSIDNHTKSIEGIAGAAVLYTMIGLLLLCFVAGLTFFSLLAILLDIAFVGAFIYVAYETRDGAGSCSGIINTVFGTGDASSQNTVLDPNGGSTALPNLKQACQLETACFSVAIVAIVFFLLSALIELALMRHHRKESAFGPSPANNYTAGSTPRRTRFWQRKRRDEAALAAGGLAAAEKRHPDSLPAHSTPADVRTSYNTDNTAVGIEAPYTKYGTGAVGDGYTAPHGSYREPGYPAATTGAVGARDGYLGAGANTATYDSAYPPVATSDARDSGYRTPTTAAGAYNPGPGEIPARVHPNNPIDSTY